MTVTALSSTSYVECDQIPLIELEELAADLIKIHSKGEEGGS